MFDLVSMSFLANVDIIISNPDVFYSSPLLSLMIQRWMGGGVGLAKNNINLCLLLKCMRAWAAPKVSDVFYDILSLTKW